MSLGWLVPKTNTPTGSNHRGHVIPIEPKSWLEAMVNKDALKRDDKLSIDGIISDVVGDPTQEEPMRSQMIMKHGCLTRMGWL